MNGNKPFCNLCVNKSYKGKGICLEYKYPWLHIIQILQDGHQWCICCSTLGTMCDPITYFNRKHKTCSQFEVLFFQCSHACIQNSLTDRWRKLYHNALQPHDDLWYKLYLYYTTKISFTASQKQFLLSLLQRLQLRLRYDAFTLLINVYV